MILVPRRSVHPPNPRSQRGFLLNPFRFGGGGGGGTNGVWWRKNGVWQGGGDPSTGTAPAFVGLAGQFFLTAGLYKGSSPEHSVRCRFESADLVDAPPSGFSAITGTFSATDKGSNVVLSSGDRVATLTGGSLSYVRGTVGKTAGAWYGEIEIIEGTVSPFQAHGITKVTETFYPGVNADSYAYLEQSGNKYNNNAETAYGATYTNGDVIGIAFCIP